MAGAHFLRIVAGDVGDMAGIPTIKEVAVIGKEAANMLGTTLLASVTFHPDGLIGWIIVGLIAGWAASHVMGDGGFGLIGDLIVGLIGALIGGVIIGFLWSGTVGVIGSIVVAFIGACILIWLLRLLSGNRVASRV